MSFNLYIYIYIHTHIYCICIATPTTTLIKNVTAVLREIILTLVYFHKMAPLLISLITNNTVAVLEIHLTNPLWFMATESLTNKVSLWRDPTHLDSPSRLVQPRPGDEQCDGQSSWY